MVGYEPVEAFHVGKHEGLEDFEVCGKPAEIQIGSCDSPDVFHVVCDPPDDLPVLQASVHVTPGRVVAGFKQNFYYLVLRKDLAEVLLNLDPARHVGLDILWFDADLLEAGCLSAGHGDLCSHEKLFVYM